MNQETDVAGKQKDKDPTTHLGCAVLMLIPWPLGFVFGLISFAAPASSATSRSGKSLFWYFFLSYPVVIVIGLIGYAVLVFSAKRRHWAKPMLWSAVIATCLIGAILFLIEALRELH